MMSMLNFAGFAQEYATFKSLLKRKRNGDIGGGALISESIALFNSTERDHLLGDFTSFLPTELRREYGVKVETARKKRRRKAEGR